MPAPPLPQVSRRLVMAVAFINAVAAFGVVATMWVTEGLVRSRLPIVALLLALVAAVWTLVLQRVIAQAVEAPLAACVRTAEAIASGDSGQRVPPGETLEFDALADSINRMTEQLLAANQYRLRAEKLATMGRLAAGVSHEIGNPVAAIANYTHVLRMRTEDVPGVREPIDALEREIGRIDRIMRGLLDYARPRRLTPKSIEVDAVIDDVLRLLADQGHTRRINLARSLEAPNGIVYAERHDLEQVFVNLLLNAVDVMDGDGTIVVRSRVVAMARFVDGDMQRRGDTPADRFPPRPSRRAVAWLSRADRPESVLQVIVADSGPGVAPEDEERIFEPFFSTKQPGKGTGLGLAIVASTIDNLGGTIWVQRAREGGAAFVILLPLYRGGLQPITPPDAPAVASS